MTGLITGLPVMGRVVVWDRIGGNGSAVERGAVPQEGRWVG